MKILLIAEPFGFGPAGSLMACRSQIENPDYRWRYIGPSFTAHIVMQEQFEQCFFMDNHDVLPEQVHDLIAWADIILSGTEFRVAEIIKDTTKKLIIYDPLFWFWPSLPELSYQNTYFICPNFDGLQEKFCQIPAHRKPYYFISRPPRYSRKDTFPADWHSFLLINLCGLVNPVLTLDGYYEMLLDCLEKVLSGSKWQKITVTGNRSLIEQITQQRRWHQFEFQTFTHDDMIKWLSCANLFITSPGLNSALEAMSLEVPTAFLPPQNNSQAYQLEIFQKHGLLPVSMDWNSFLPVPFAWKDDSPRRSIHALKQAMNACHASETSLRQLSRNLEKIVHLSEASWRDYQKRQSCFFLSLSSETLKPFPEIFDELLHL